VLHGFPPKRSCGAGRHRVFHPIIAPGVQPLAWQLELEPRAILRTVPDLTSLCKELELTWHRDIPLAAAMSIGVAGYDGRTLTVRAPLPPNRNLHGTAFAGSLFSTCVLTGWGATWLALRERRLTGVIVVADSDIHYRKAVAGELVCRCTPDGEELRDGLELFAAKGRASFELACAIDHEDKRAVTFTGKYVVHAQHS
jgi:thioesterase domain-containing protein